MIIATTDSLEAYAIILYPVWNKNVRLISSSWISPRLTQPSLVYLPVNVVAYMIQRHSKQFAIGHIGALVI